ncbi:MAG: undecaprenyl-diphosphate phosphatase [Atribacterota bacterium]
MNWQPIILGGIQGLTEFFPISSSAHLIFFYHFFFRETPSLWFDVILHGGTWLAVLLYLYPYYRRLFRRPILILNVLLATVPAGILGYLLEEKVESYFRTQFQLTSLILFFLGVVFLVFRKEGFKDLGDMTFSESFLVGCAQALALFPGVSRSGITLLTLFALNFKREEAVLFSFLLSLTTIGGAFLKGIYEIRASSLFPSVNLWSGFIASFACGILACFVLLKVVRHRGLRPFGYYRIVIGIITFLAFYFSKT